ncbi:MAG: ion channel [Myxococcaceae bacterium]
MAEKPPLPLQIRLFSTNQRQLQIINGGSLRLADVYYRMLRWPWRTLFAFIAVAFLALNALFGLAFWAIGGVQNSDGSYLDHFFFSVQTFGTIGYGAMFPASRAAHFLVVFEALVSLVTNAMVTGLIFAKFARPSARILWSQNAVICDRDGVPTLMFRMANERANHVVEAQLHAAIVRAERTKEGEPLRRVVDLELVRNNSPTFILTWTAMHVINEKSPLWGLTQEGLAAQQAEIVLTLMGLDDTIMQTIHSRTSFLPAEVKFGHKFADVIGQVGGQRVLDYGRMHGTVPAKLTWRAMGVDRDPENVPP